MLAIPAGSSMILVHAVFGLNFIVKSYSSKLQTTIFDDPCSQARSGNNDGHYPTVEHVETFGYTPVPTAALTQWQNYCFSPANYNPLTEWGEHYTKIFDGNLWRAESPFDSLDINNGDISNPSGPS